MKPVLEIFPQREPHLHCRSDPKRAIPLPPHRSSLLVGHTRLMVPAHAGQCNRSAVADMPESRYEEGCFRRASYYRSCAYRKLHPAVNVRLR